MALLLVKLIDECLHPVHVGQVLARFVAKLFDESLLGPNCLGKFTSGLNMSVHLRINLSSNGFLPREALVKIAVLLLFGLGAGVDRDGMVVLLLASLRGTKPRHRSGIGHLEASWKGVLGLQVVRLEARWPRNMYRRAPDAHAAACRSRSRGARRSRGHRPEEPAARS